MLFHTALLHRAVEEGITEETHKQRPKDQIMWHLGEKRSRSREHAQRSWECDVPGGWEESKEVRAAEQGKRRGAGQQQGADHLPLGCRKKSDLKSNSR